MLLAECLGLGGGGPGVLLTECVWGWEAGAGGVTHRVCLGLGGGGRGCYSQSVFGAGEGGERGLLTECVGGRGASPNTLYYLNVVLDFC